VKIERWLGGKVVQQAGMAPLQVPTDRFTHIVAKVNETRCSIFVDRARVNSFEHAGDIPDVAAPMTPDLEQRARRDGDPRQGARRGARARAPPSRHRPTVIA
jgi:hypothetical protein